jgi:hypothetical protein
VVYQIPHFVVSLCIYRSCSSVLSRLGCGAHRIPCEQTCNTFANMVPDEHIEERLDKENDERN